MIVIFFVGLFAVLLLPGINLAQPYWRGSKGVRHSRIWLVAAFSVEVLAIVLVPYVLHARDGMWVFDGVYRACMFSAWAILVLFLLGKFAKNERARLFAASLILAAGAAPATAFVSARILGELFRVKYVY